MDTTLTRGDAMQEGKLHTEARPPLVLMDGGKSRRAYRALLREGIVGCIAARPRKAEKKPTRRMYKTAEDEKHPLGPIERLIRDVCQMRDVIPDEKLAAYDLECLYGKVQGAVAQAVAHGIEQSNQRREAAKRGMGA